MHRTRLVAVLAAVSVVLGSATLASAAPAYSTTVVGPFSQQYRFGLALNNLGDVTGGTTGAQAFFYDGTFHRLGKPAGAKFSVGEGISDTDVIAATAQKGSVRSAYAATYNGVRATWMKLAGLPGYQQSQAEAILPDGSAIAGEICATRDPACSHLTKHSRAVVWKRSGGAWAAPIVLPVGKGSVVSTVSGIARAGSITVVAGSIAPTNGGTAKAVLWLLPVRRSFTLPGTAANPVATVSAIAHGSGNTFYLAGTVAQPTWGTYGQPVMQTVVCTRTACYRTKLQTITSLGETYSVNNQGAVTGYQRVGGDPGGYFVWQAGKMQSISSGSDINNAGQIVGWRLYPPLTRNSQVILLTPTS